MRPPKPRMNVHHIFLSPLPLLVRVIVVFKLLDGPLGLFLLVCLLEVGPFTRPLVVVGYRSAHAASTRALVGRGRLEQLAGGSEIVM